MSTFEVPSFSSGGRRFSTWSNQFCTRQPLQIIAEDDILPVKPGQAESDAFVHAGEDVLSPPCFNWKPLDAFLQRAHLGDLTDGNPCPHLTRLCLIDDRSSSSQSKSPPNRQSEQQLHPTDGVPQQGTNIPQLSTDVFRKNLNERELYHRLLRKVGFSFQANSLLTICSYQEPDIYANRRVL
jgi:hypothetical protein